MGSLIVTSPGLGVAAGAGAARADTARVRVKKEVNMIVKVFAFSDEGEADADTKSEVTEEKELHHFIFIVSFTQSIHTRALNRNLSRQREVFQ